MVFLSRKHIALGEEEKIKTKIAMELLLEPLIFFLQMRNGGGGKKQNIARNAHSHKHNPQLGFAPSQRLNGLWPKKKVENNIIPNENLTVGQTRKYRLVMGWSNTKMSLLHFIVFRKVGTDPQPCRIMDCYML